MIEHFTYPFFVDQWAGLLTLDLENPMATNGTYPPGWDRDKTWKYIYHICRQIERGTATPQQWRFLNKYANPKLAETMRKEAIKYATGISKRPTPERP